MEAGRLIAGRYMVERLAGLGGMSEVYKARDHQGRAVALKVLRLATEQTVERFVRESRALERLEHPAIVRYLDSGITSQERRHFLVMEWLEGVDLGRHLEQGRLDLDACLRLGERLASALAAVHALGMVHRDVKPSNVFLCDRQVDRAKLLDFGIARWEELGRFTRTGESPGTPAYMSPEQARGERSLDGRSDVFALGCLLYKCLADRTPFVTNDGRIALDRLLFEDAPPLASFVPDIPDSVAALVHRMLARNPAMRPSSGAEVADAIRALRPSAAPNELSRSPRPSRRTTTLTGQEQCTVSVVVVRSAPGHHAPVPVLAALADQHAGIRPDPDDDTELQNIQYAPTVVARAQMTDPCISALYQQLDALGARCQVLDGGLVAAVLDGHAATRGETAVDQASNAARCALALESAFPGAPVALATGRIVKHDQQMVAEIIERAAALLDAGGHRGSACPEPGVPPGVLPPGSHLPGVHIDEVTSMLVRHRFQVQGDATGGLLLVREEPSRSSQRLPFKGRRGELASLLGILDECLDEQVARVVLVTGHAGIGKSRLCEELLAQVHRRGGGSEIQVWMASGDPMRTESPLYLFASAVRHAAGIVDSEPASQRRARLHARVARHVEPGHAQRIEAFLSELLAIQVHGDTGDVQLRAARRDAQLMGDHVRRACHDLLDAETAAHPVLLVLDDLHWGDRVTIEVLGQALRDLGERPLMILALARPEVHDRYPGLWASHSITEIQLPRLPRRTALELVRHGLPGALEPAYVDSLVDRAGGIPYYLEELIRLGPAAVDILPETVAAMVEARLDALHADTRRILRAASVFGRVFWLGGVAALVGNDTDCADWLAIAVSLDLIEEAPASRFAGQREYRFRHDLMREGAYQMLTDRDRQLGHVLAGEWLVQAGEPDARLLARHFELGGEPARAVPFYARAADEALGRGDLDGALAMTRRGLACEPKGRLLGAFRRVQTEEQIWRGNNAAVIEHGSQALALLEPGTREWYEILGEVAAAHAKLGHGDQLDAIGAALALGAGPTHDPSGRLTAMAKVAMLGFAFGREQRAQAMLAEVEAQTAALERIEPALAANVHFCRAFRAETVLGDPAAVLIEELGCVACFEEIGDLRQVCLHRGNVGYARMALGLYDQAEEDLRAAIATAERLGLDLAAQGARQKLGSLLAHRGQQGEAELLERQACAWFDAHGDTRMAALARLSLATIATLAGDLDSAGKQARAVLDTLAPRSPLRPTALAMLARVHLLGGSAGTARDLAQEAATLLDALGNIEGNEAFVRLAHAEALEAAGEPTSARAALAHAHTCLLERAGKIGHTEWRRCYLDRIPEHARIVALARAWLITD